MYRWDECRNRRLAAWFHRWSMPIRRWFGGRPRDASFDIDGLAQEVFERLQRDGDDAGVGDPQGYLLRVAADVANEWRDKARSRRPRNPGSLTEVQLEPCEESENTAARALARKRLQAIVQSLPRRQSEVLLLHFQDGLTCGQIAQKQGRSHKAVLQDVTRAYGRLRFELELKDIVDTYERHKAP